MGRGSCFVIITALFISCSVNHIKESKENEIIPYPARIETGNGEFYYTLPKLWSSGLNENEKEIFEKIVRSVNPSIVCTNNEEDKGIIKIIKTESANIPEEGYTLSVNKNKIEILGNSYGGLLYGLMTVIQLGEITLWKIPAITIEDAPQFKYRGFMLDVSRNFFSVDYIKKLLRAMAFYKMNTFRWHLVDGAGWRIEIKKHPELTEYGAWRPYKNFKEWNSGGRKFCKKNDTNAVGGYYTQKDIVDIVEYAKKLNITVIPSLTMPTHCEEVIAAFPELSCKKGEKTDRLCLGKDKSFELIEDVLSEIIPLFKSKNIYIDGSAFDYGTWDKCPRCKDITMNGHKYTSQELSSYFVNRIHIYLKKFGIQAIAEKAVIRHNKLPSSINIISRKSNADGYYGLTAGHNLIISSTAHCFLGNYQGDPNSEPLAIGGFIPLEKIYSLKPIPDFIYDEEKRQILGVEAELWTEYVDSEELADYMIFPRLLAIAEVGWSMQNNKNLERFMRAINNGMFILDKMGINAREISPDIKTHKSINLREKKIALNLYCDKIPAEIHYTTDGSEPNLSSDIFKDPIIIKDSLTVKAATFQNNKKISNTFTFKEYFHKGIGKDVTYNKNYSKYYPADGETSLSDGYTGTFAYNDGIWQGFTGDVDIILDLDKETKIKKICAKFLQQPNLWIWFPEHVRIFVADNNKEFKLIKEIDNKDSNKSKYLCFKDFGYDGDSITARYIRYIATMKDNDKTYMFTDELIVN